MNPTLHIGDVTVPARWANSQEHLFAREVPGGWDPGPFGDRWPNFGMMFPRGTMVTVPGKLKRRGRRQVPTSAWKKAIVQLKPGDRITYFEGV